MKNHDEAKVISRPAVEAVEKEPGSIGVTPSSTTAYPGTIDRIKVDSAGCVLLFRFGRGAVQYYWVRLNLAHSDYSAIYSLFLACWLNQRPIIAVVQNLVVADPEPGFQWRTLVQVEAGDHAEALWAAILRA